MGFEGKTAWITGGSSGIGLALGKQLAAQGAKVWLLARRLDVLDAALEEIRKAGKPWRQCGRISVDVTDWNGTQAAVQRLLAETGAPDLLINSAGAVEPGMINTLEIDVFREMMEVNYLGTVHVVKAVLPEMIKRRAGYIVNISSMAGYLSALGYSAYAASKFALRGFTDALRMEMKPHGIRVSIVFPPDTDTPQLAYDNAMKPMELKALVSQNTKVSTPAAVATEILSGVKRGRYIILPGSDSKLYYWMSSLLGSTQYQVMDLYMRRALKRAKKRK